MSEVCLPRQTLCRGMCAGKFVFVYVYNYACLFLQCRVFMFTIQFSFFPSSVELNSLDSQQIILIAHWTVSPQVLRSPPQSPPSPSPSPLPSVERLTTPVLCWFTTLLCLPPQHSPLDARKYSWIAIHECSTPKLIGRNSINYNSAIILFF